MLTPNRQCYWVEPGRLLAGEYPRELDEAASRAKLAAYLDCGIDLFIDLTEPGELLPYAALLQQLAQRRGIGVEHCRFAIADKSVPADPATMQAILARLHTALADGRGVYVHCWGGVGRTGTVIGCYLIETGWPPAAALQQVNTLWQSVAKVERHPQSPETAAQRQWVAAWPPSSAYNCP